MSPSSTAWMPDPVDLERPPSPSASSAWMPVLVKDLCDPDVVAAIAKRRFFDIKDRTNLTPEIWEKFSVPGLWIQKILKRNFGEKNLELYILQPVLVDDHANATRKYRDCHPRLSESPNPEEAGYPVSDCDTPISSYEENLEHWESGAKEAYNALIQMGGKPTGPIRPTLPWKKVLVDGKQCYEYAERHETLFHSTWHGNRARDENTKWTEADFVLGHWAAECRQFREELRRWQDFLNTQRWRYEHRPEFARKEDMERQRYPQDPDLTASLKKLKDWKDYQSYFQSGIDRCKKQAERARQAVEAIQRKDPEVVLNKREARGQSDEGWRREIEETNKQLVAEEKLLKWAKQQLPAVLSECAASLTGASTSRRKMEERSECEAKEVFNTLVETGGRPTRSIRPMPASQEHEYTDEHLHILCHWQGECSQFEEELREWRKFLDYRKRNVADGTTDVQLQGRQSAETTTQVDLWKDYRTYQQLEVKNAKQWVEFWQRQVEDCQETAEKCAQEGSKGIAKRYRSIGEDMKSHVEDARTQVRPAEMRLEWVEQQLSALLAERLDSMTQVSTFDGLKSQVDLPKRISKSDQITFNDLRSNRSGKSGSRDYQDKKKSRASADSTLGQSHPSRISKAARREAPRRQRKSKTLAEKSDGQNQSPNIAIGPVPPANLSLRRSSRFSSNDNKSSALEGNLMVDLGNSTRSPPNPLRRSERLSKQREAMRTSLSNTAMDSAIISQKGTSRRLSRFQHKGGRGGNKSNRGSVVKPRGISKR